MYKSIENTIQGEKKLLEIGDKLYNKEYSRWTSKTRYEFATVERLTKTQAILSNGTRLINELTKNHFDSIYGYSVFGNISARWYIVTESVLLEAEKEKERQVIDYWFAKRVFSSEEKRIIYFKFKELGLLDIVKSKNDK